MTIEIDTAEFETTSSVPIESAARPRSHQCQPSRRSGNQITAVGAACRQLVAGVQAGASDPEQLKLALAIVSLVTSWIRLEGEVQVAQVAALIGRSDRFTRAKLTEMSQEGLIVWKPARGRSARSILGLPRPAIHEDHTSALARARPGTHSGQGVLYLIQFDNGVIKAGRTQEFDVRRVEHERQAGRLDVRILRTWTSAVSDAAVAEWRLLRLLDKVAERTPAGREYFRGVPFTIACSLATGDGVRIENVPCCCGACIGPIELTIPATVVSPAGGREDPRLVAQFKLGCGGRITGLLQDPDLASDGAYPLQVGKGVMLNMAPSTDPIPASQPRAWIVWSVTRNAADSSTRL